jgi:phosphatidate cytidylyltransferase
MESGGTMSWPWLAFGLIILIAFFGEIHRYQKPGGVTINLAGTIFGTAYIGFLFSFVVLLRLNWTVGALASLIVVVKLGDIGAYTVGRLIGRHKMAPVLSPGKTIEGACGAVAFAVLGSWLVAGLLFPYCLGMAVTGWLLYGILVGLAGLFGDLAESLLKRDVGAKDSSEWLPGFGGVLDILDSILFAAPVAYACWAMGLIKCTPIP